MMLIKKVIILNENENDNDNDEDDDDDDEFIDVDDFLSSNKKE